MTHHTLDSRIDAALRQLDPAPPSPLSEAGAIDAAALLARIVATDPDTTGRTGPSGATDALTGARLADLVPAPRRRTGRRLALSGLAATVLTVGSLVLPGRSPEFAYADWTSAPSSVTAQDASRAAAACRDSVESIGGGGGGEPLPASGLSTRLVERRGAWVLTLLTATDADDYHWDASCIVHLPSGTDGPPVVVATGASGGGGFPSPSGAELSAGSVSEFGPPSALEAWVLGVPRHAETFSTTNGEVGPDVVGVTIHAGDRTVEASVADGTYAAWWPGPAFAPSTIGAPSGQGGPEPAITYDVTLRDGSVRRKVTPTNVTPTRG